MRLDAKCGAEHFLRDVSEQNFDVVQNVGDVLLKCRGIYVMEELNEKRV